MDVRSASNKDETGRTDIQSQDKERKTTNRSSLSPERGRVHHLDFLLLESSGDGRVGAGNEKCDGHSEVSKFLD